MGYDTRWMRLLLLKRMGVSHRLSIEEIRLAAERCLEEDYRAMERAARPDWKAEIVAHGACAALIREHCDGASTSGMDADTVADELLGRLRRAGRESRIDGYFSDDDGFARATYGSIAGCIERRLAELGWKVGATD
ncbi:MAG: hypothetical protein ACPGU7_03775 [Gammaproteobacteria bacterium]